jgi:hypothetical protein
MREWGFQLCSYLLDFLLASGVPAVLIPVTAQ